MNKVTCIKFMAILLLLLTVGSCSDNSPIKIGFVGSITGPYSELGVTARNTLQLLTDEKNEAGGVNGRKLELIVKDDKSSPDGAKAAIIDLIANDVRLILGPITSSMAEATTEAIEGQNVLDLSPTMSTDFLAGKDDNLLRTSTSSTGQANIVVDKITSLNLHRTAIIYDVDNKKYSLSIAERFTKLMKDDGKSVPVSIAYSSSKGVDFNSVAKQIAESKVDSVFFVTNGFDGAMLAQSFHKVGLNNLSLFGVSWTQSNDVITHGGKAVEGMRLIALYDYSKPDPEIIALKNNYIARYNKEPSFIYTRYAGIFEIAVWGLEAAKKYDPAAIKEKIISKKEFDIIGRHIIFDKFGDVAEEFDFVIIKDGKFVNDN